MKIILFIFMCLNLGLLVLDIVLKKYDMLAFNVVGFFAPLFTLIYIKE